MEVAMEFEDDLFFADLSKQISLLIMDDEDPAAPPPSVSFQAYSRANYPTAQSPFMYEQSCRRESKGTGVFIPQSTQPRRKQKQGRYSANTFQTAKGQTQKKLDSTRSMASQVTAYTNSYNPNQSC